MFYPLLMTAPVLVWWARRPAAPFAGPLPWAAFAFICAPFFIDVTGNTLDLYDAVVWWDDAQPLRQLAAAVPRASG